MFVSVIYIFFSEAIVGFNNADSALFVWRHYEGAKVNSNVIHIHNHRTINNMCQYVLITGLLGYTCDLIEEFTL